MDEFRFKTRLDQTLLLGLKARNVRELLEGIESVPDSSIYHHTHRYLQQHHYLSPEPPNDFAYWIREVLNDRPLAEEIASIDTVQFGSIPALRKALAGAIRPRCGAGETLRDCPPGGEFHFMASRIFVLGTPHAAANLGEFLSALRLVTVGSLYFHIFEARLRLGRGENDFSFWFRAHGMPDLADRIASLDPYSYTLEGLRNEILRLGESNGAH
jgi:hypothetical protein